MFQLKIEDGRGGVLTYLLSPGDECIVGSSPTADVCVQSRSNRVSDHHAVFMGMPDAVFMQDLLSRYGTFMGGRRVDAALLNDSDFIYLGGETVRVTVLGLPSIQARFAGARDDTTEEEIRAGSYACSTCGMLLGQKIPTTIPLICRPCAERRRTLDGESVRIGQFELLSLQSDGPGAIVYEGWEPDRGWHVAVKVMKLRPQRSSKEVRRFVREQHASLALLHPRIVRGVCVGEDDDGRPFLASEFVNAGDAERLCSRDIQMGLGLALGADVFEALSVLHRRGLIHRDVKPRNVLIDSDQGGTPRAKLCDLGLIRAIHGFQNERLTETNDVAGTPYFIAPEQLEDFHGTGASADMYSAAATFYQLVTGEVPFPKSQVEGPTLRAALAATMHVDRIPIRSYRADIPAAVSDAVDKLLARDPSFRKTKSAEWVKNLFSRHARSLA